MKIIGLREAQKHLCGLVDHSQKESVMLTRHGQPVAVLRGVGKKMKEKTPYDDKFWNEIDASRNSERSYTSDEIREMFNIPKLKKTTAKKSPRRRNKKSK